MKTLYGMCENEHLLWRCSSDCTALLIYYWDGEMPVEDKLSRVWKSLYDTGFEETCTVPIGDLKRAMDALEVRDVTFWTILENEEDITNETVKGVVPFSFREFLVRLRNGARVASYVMPNGRKAVSLPDIPPAMKVRDFLSSAVPLIWERAKKGLTPLQKCDIAIENLGKLIRIYGPDPIFSRALELLGRAREEIVQEPVADILDQKHIDNLYARASDTSFRDPREPDKKKAYSDNRDDISKALKKDNVPKVTYRITYPSEKISGERVENKESNDPAFKATVKKEDLDALVDSYNYLQSAEIIRHNDPVNHPSHYQLHGGMEVIDIIEAVTWDLPGNEAYAIGNAIKYICRYRNKGKPVQDLEKAKWYIENAIEDYKKREEGE